MFSQGISPVTLSEQLVAALLKQPDANTTSYELCEKLMSVPKAHFPQLLLLSSLLGSIAVETPEVRESPKNIKSTSHDHTVPLKVTEPKADVIAEKPIQKSSGVFDWDAILAATKKTSPALHSVLSRAHTRLDGSTLHCAFQYALHRKKLDQPQYRTQLIRVIQDVCGLNLDIVIDAEGAESETDSQTQQIAELMGGGERVRV
jgi:hypothetical protein